MTDIEAITEDLEPEKDITEILNEDLDETNAADIAAAAVADFDDDEEEDKEKDVNVIIKSNKNIYSKNATNFASKSSTNQKSNKIAVDIDDPGDINGKPTVEYNVNEMQDEDKPWKRPGADLTEYFNYGFTEETWIKYCEKQKIIRLEYANSTLKPLSNTNYITGMHPKPRPNKIENLGIVQQPVFNPYMATSVAFNQNLVNVMNNPSGGGSINLVGDLNVPPPGFGGIWSINNGMFVNPDDNRGDESPGSDYHGRKMKRDYREVEGYGSRNRRHSRSDSESRHRKKRREERDYDRISRREKSGERSRRNRSRSRSRNRTRRHDSRQRHERADRDRGSRRAHDRDRERERDRDRERRPDRDYEKSSSSRNHDSKRDSRREKSRREEDSSMPDESMISSNSNPPNPDAGSSMIVIQGDLKREH